MSREGNMQKERPANVEEPERRVEVAGVLTHAWQDGIRRPFVALLDREGNVDWSTGFYAEHDGSLNLTDRRVRGMRDGPRPGR